MEDIFGDIFNGGSPFDNIFGGQSRNVKRGSNLRIKVNMNLHDIAKGCNKKIKIKRQVSCNDCHSTGSMNGETTKCNHCNGSGQTRKVVNTIMGQMISQAPCNHCNGEGNIIVNKCKTCNGQGTVEKEETVDIQIPAGVMGGMQLAMNGKGNMTSKGGVAGDLLIVIEETPDPNLRRDNLNVIYDLNISFVDAIFGVEVDVPTIIGKEKIKIKNGIQGGDTIKLSGKGIKDVNSHRIGDEIINVKIYTPETLSNEEKDLLLKLKDSNNFKPKK